MNYEELKKIIHDVWFASIHKVLWNNGFADTKTLLDIEKYMWKKLDKYNSKPKKSDNSDQTLCEILAFGNNKMNKKNKEEWFVVISFGLIAQVFVYLAYKLKGTLTLEDMFFVFVIYLIFAILCYVTGTIIKSFPKAKTKKIS